MYGWRVAANFYEEVASGRGAGGPYVGKDAFHRVPIVLPKTREEEIGDPVERVLTGSSKYLWF
jgi:hypothetical protein